MKEKELISVIIPVYNIEGYLLRCMETIAAQSYRNLEIILVDDGSTDMSGKICDSYAEKDSRVIVIHQKNQGLFAARNSGQRAAKGEYLMFVDGDDYLHVDAIRAMHEAINQNGGCDLAMCDRKFTERFDENIYEEGTNKLTDLSQEELITNMFTHDDSVLFVYQWNKLYRKELIENIWSLNYYMTEDFDYNFRVYLKVKRAVWIHRILYFYVQRKGSIVHSSDVINYHYINMIALLFDNYQNLSNNQSIYSRLLLKKMYRKMAFFKGKIWKTKVEPRLYKRLLEYEKATRKVYWINLSIPLYEKVFVTILLHSPRLTRWLLKVTKNY